MNTTKCLHCDAENRFTEASRDGLGWHILCPGCDCSYDIDIEDFLIPNGTTVKFFGNGKGTVVGNNAKIAEEFKDIAYRVRETKGRRSIVVFRQNEIEDFLLERQN